MKKILITGTCGFLLSNFIRKAIYEKQPYSFVSVDRVSGNANSLYSHKNHLFHVADIRDQHIMDKIFQFERPDIVIHAADESFINTSLSNPSDLITSNVLGTQVIINCCLNHNVERLIYTSTDKVYGQLMSESQDSWKEDNLLNPRNPYSTTKVASELLIKAAFETHGLLYNIVRFSNIYGPRQRALKLIPKSIKCILNDQKIELYDQGLQIRDWVHVFDAGAALLSVLNNGKNNQVYNVSANQELQNIEVIQKICNVMNGGYHLISFIDGPKSQDFRRAMNSSKIKELGWEPTFKFKDGIDQCVNWYLLNKWILK